MRRRKKSHMVTHTHKACKEMIVYVCATVHECVARELTKQKKNQTKTIQCKQITSNVLWFTLTIVKPMTMVSTSWTFYVASVHMLLQSSKQQKSRIKIYVWKHVQSNGIYFHRFAGIECDAATLNECFLFHIWNVDKQTVHKR